MSLLKRWQHAFKLEVYYDGWCPMCTAIRQRLEKMDRLRLLTWVSIRDQAAVQRIPIPFAALETRMYTKKVRNNTYVSDIRAIAAIVARIPLLWLFWPFLKLAQFTGLGSYVYHYVAKKRRIVPVGACDESCGIEEGNYRKKVNQCR
ncbi:thiol-disulfide oxidoreductase DCC family protein [Rubeoparvulum massiliense]|uniref:thiol-disulfide oxidoreductase DCC family protein n=1 Tax=Rubeoparvulum massiliense TaxID=1631346 RepID=UPI00065E35F5|nr:DUF393 domain-containing protein [Rubeoparvulum massiliense]